MKIILRDKIYGGNVDPFWEWLEKDFDTFMSREIVIRVNRAIEWPMRESLFYDFRLKLIDGIRHETIGTT